MKILLSVVILGLASLISGCGEDDGSFAGTWNSANGFSRYILTTQDNGYKAQYQRKVSSGEMIDGKQLFLKKKGSYLALDNDSHFLEVINDNELKLSSSGMIFNKGSEN